MVRKFLEDIFRRKLDVLHSARVVHTLYQQQKKGKYCDLKVIVGDRQYFVHRCVLASASTQLDAQINDLNTIQLVGVTNYGFERLLEILYSGKMAKVATVDSAKFHEIVSAADALNAENVIEYCARERSDLMKLVLDKSPDLSKTSTSGEVSTVSVTDVLTAESPAMDSPATDVGEGMVSSNPVSNEASPAPMLDLQVPNVFSSASKEDKMSEDPPQGMPGPEVKHEPVEVAESLVESIAADVEIDDSAATKVCSTPSAPISAQQKVLTGSYGAKVDSQQIQTSKQPIMAEPMGLKKGVQCSICKRMFSTPHHLKAHMKKHTSSSVLKPYKCDTCGMKFSFHTTLISHMKLHSVKRFICKICGRDFKLNRNLQLHLENVHSEEFDVNNAQQSGMNSLSLMQKAKPNSDIENLKSIVEDVQAGVDGKFGCPLCGKRFSRRWNLKCHVLTHSENRSSRPKFASKSLVPLLCPECGASFENPNALQKHTTLFHSHGEMLYGFNNASNPFQSEMSPSGEGTSQPAEFWCDICGRGFRRLRNLRSHMETHSGMGYECHICGRTFAQKDGLNGHLWVHGGLGGSKTPNLTMEQKNWNEETQSEQPPT